VFLDLRVFKGSTWSRSGRLDVAMHFKATGLGIPLDDKSCHPPSVHRWPIARFNTFGSRVTSREFLLAAQRHLISDLARGCPAHACLPSLRASLGYRSVVAVQHVVPDRPRNSWVVIPFHPVWFNAGLGGIGKSLFGTWSSLIADVLLELGINDYLTADAFCVGISWSLGGRHFNKSVKTW
jgi:hypothetical protein